ncbi:hypothetical protein ED733_002350 [Metarhizium rileyi]|uniref:Uncharacterized protein n=1 Tax=Metarhizium rileyi (strain RCEF 4871) TaxID=1649241 RepID=A0A5C6G965_METRR|nr:hypothetical protein ED733_002350 [Metarhizium rileyi]
MVEAAQDLAIEYGIDQTDQQTEDQAREAEQALMNRRPTMLHCALALLCIEKMLPKRDYHRRNLLPADDDAQCGVNECGQLITAVQNYENITLGAESVYVCENDAFNQPCSTIKAPLGECVAIPELLEHKVSSVRPSEAAGTCRFYSATNCEGEYFEATHEGADLVLTHPNYNDRVVSLLCGTTRLETAPQRWEWTGQSREKICHEIHDLSLGFQLSDAAGAGTYDTIVLGFGDGLPEHIIADGPSAGFDEWQNIDLKRIFASDTIRMDQIKELSLTTRAVHWFYGGDEWFLIGLKLKARCVGLDIPVVMEKFKALNSAKAWNNPIKHTNRYDALVWQDSVNVEDWTARPPCSHVESMDITINLDKYSARTKNGLIVEAGDWERRIVHEPYPGTTYKVDIDLERAYSSRLVPLANIERISIKSRGGYDAVKISNVKLHANCGTLPIAMERNLDDWLYDDQRFDLALTAEEWVGGQD